MATVARAAEVLSQALGVSTADIQHRARRLREAGLLPSEGKGRGAPHVESLDCARLLIATLAADVATDSPHAVTTVDKEGPAIRATWNGQRVVLAPRTTFVSAVSFLIERLRDPNTQPTWVNALRRVGVSRVGDGRPHGWIEPQPAAGDYLSRVVYGVVPRLALGRGKGPGYVAVRNIAVTEGGKLMPGLEDVGPGLNHDVFVGVRPLMRLALILDGHGGTSDGETD